MRGRTPEKWFSLRTDFFGSDSYHLNVYSLSPVALGAYFASISYVCRYGNEACHRAQIRHLGVKRVKPVVDELVELGFWIPTHETGWFYVCHEGTLWRRGDGKSRRAIPIAVRKAVMERDNFACVECGRVASLSLDHIFPYSLGGEDTIENLRVLCRSCNSKKGARI